MLKTTIFVNENIDISKFVKLRAFLKRQNAGYKPKKSNTFSRERINQFLEEAPDEKYLLMKVVMLMGITGACRSHELCAMKLENVKETGDLFIVTIPDSKSGMSRMFIITEHLAKVKRYIELRSKLTIESPRFFMRYQDGRCFNQPVGRNTFIEIPCRIAKYLNLENPESYTGRAFRRTSTMLAANASFPESFVGVPPRSQIQQVDVPMIVKDEVMSDNEASSVEDNASEASCAPNRVSYNINDNEVVGLSTSRCKDEIVINGSEFSSSADQNINITKTDQASGGKPSFVINVSNCSNCNLTININY
ncbi:uncharacterized protein LOC100142506 isoform X2 [Tribolium castaneum]|nr:PREDICTED: uncharacterized protein LOC100142506 isoform X2 [Tribolium castaneum]XP_008194854.1 PREDICTED: uncharacterized protein LOC100142506 isoform X2 [Tribolium castaneum]|eukprot:XP_008194853.1 PREDICTED: uncharacterized protein LOC100142506 isoform X2 [Tribolium castaneum]